MAVARITNMGKLLGHDEERYRHYRALLAPGTPLRSGLNRISQGHTGGLIVLGNNAVVKEISTGGFEVNTPFTPTALRELSKMDGGIVLSDDLDVIVKAAVHFVPDGSLPTIETGTRHRTADRIAQQAEIPAVTVSAAMSTTTLFMSGLRYPIESSEQILMRANQALDTLTRFHERLDEQSANLSMLEVDDRVTVADFIKTIQPVAMMRRLNQELETYVEALGVDGRLLQLQLYELTSDMDQFSSMLELDYKPEGAEDFHLDDLSNLPTGDLLDGVTVAETLGLPPDLTAHMTSRGFRQVTQAAQMSTKIAGYLLEHFGGLQALFTATPKELREVKGVSEAQARAIRDGLTRLAARLERQHG